MCFCSFHKNVHFFFGFAFIEECEELGEHWSELSAWWAPVSREIDEFKGESCALHIIFIISFSDFKISLIIGI